MAEGVNIFVSGRTGTGKSYLVKQAIADCPRLLVYLPKREDHGYPGVYFDGLAEGGQNRRLMLEWWQYCEQHGRRFRLVYRPRDAYDFTEFDEICGLVYACGRAPIHFVCEEISTYVSPSIFTPDRVRPAIQDAPPGRPHAGHHDVAAQSAADRAFR